MRVLVALSLLCGLGRGDPDFVTFRLPSGPVRGQVVQTKNGNVNVFRGIPYSEPRLGPTRFSAPVPKQSWSDVFDATHYKPNCGPNVTIVPRDSDDLDEDCLYINVYADQRCNRTSPCPVVFYVYGGSNVYTTQTLINETDITEKFASHNLIFVLPSFRRGIFGFLDIGSPAPDAPYNVGVHDVITAFRFTQRELLELGADIGRIAGFGHASGAGILSLLHVSPAVERNAFNKLLLLSPMPTLNEHFNQPLSEETLDRTQCALRDGRLLSKDEKMDCLRHIPFEDLVQASVESQFLYKRVLPQTDSVLFPGETTAELFFDWKPIPALITVTAEEMPLSAFMDGTLLEACVVFCRMLGYVREATVAACHSRYGSGADGLRTQDLARDAFHAMAYRLAAINADRAGPSYFSVFAQKNANRHANDLMYVLGIQRDAIMAARRNETDVEDSLMNDFYPAIFRAFIAEDDSPLEGWIPVDSQGRNYLSSAFRTIGGENNLTVIRRPLFHFGEIFNERAVDLWLRVLAQIEENANAEEKNSADMNFQQHQVEHGVVTPTVPNEAEFTILFWILVGITCLLAIAVVLLAVPCFAAVPPEAEE